MISNNHEISKYVPIIEEEYLYEGLIYTYGIFTTVWKLSQQYSTDDITFHTFNNENRFYVYIKRGNIKLSHLKVIIKMARDVCGWDATYYKINNEKSRNLIIQKNFVIN